MKPAIITLVASFTLLQVPNSLGDEPPAPVAWERIATYKEKQLVEISGLAASRRHEGVYWAHNDSGGDPAVHAIHQDGRFLGSVAIEGVRNEDWEDMAAFAWNGKPYLILGDTGDNLRKRQKIQLIIIEEPERYDLPVRPAWTVSARYENGAKDCEALAVVPGTDRVFLLSKDKKASVIYETSFLPNQGEPPRVLRPLVTLAQTANATAKDSFLSSLKAGILGSQATAMDISPDGKRLAVLTYTDVRIYNNINGDWKTTLAKPPKTFALPEIFQPEALSFSATGSQQLFISSEEYPVPLLKGILNF